MSSSIWIWAVGLFRSLIYFLDSIVYGFIIDLYNIFRWICGARIVDNSILNELATRVGFILGLVMFFYISFDFIQILLDPDKLTDKDKGPLNIIKKFLIVIVLLGTSRYIFDLMYNFQNIVLSNDDGNGSVIEKLLLPYDIKSESFGNAISSQFFANFYRVNSAIEVNDTNEETKMDVYTYRECEDFANALPTVIAASGNFSLGKECLNETYKTDKVVSKKLLIATIPVRTKDWFIDFNVLSLPVGIFVAWMLIMYCISVGMRVIQLVVLQIISPAAIICYLSPNKENTFTKWLKVYIATYIDVFIRIAIIDFVVLVSGLVLETNNLSSDSGVTTTDGMKFWIIVFMIMALLSFAKKAPDLIKKLLPSNLQSGLSFGLSAKERPGFGMVTKPAKRVASYGVSAGVGGFANALIGTVDRARMAKRLGKTGAQRFGAAMSGLGGGILRGFKQGFHNKGNFMKNIPAGFKAQHQADVKYENLIASGGTARGVLWSKASSHFGETEGQFLTRIINDADRMDDFKKQMYAAADEAVAVKSAKDTWQNMIYDAKIYGEGEEGLNKFEKAKQAAYDRYRGLRNSFVEAAIRNETTYAGGDMNEDDQRYAAGVRSVIASANTYSESHSVKKWDEYAKVNFVETDVASDLKKSIDNLKRDNFASEIEFVREKNSLMDQYKEQLEKDRQSFINAARSVIEDNSGNITFELNGVTTTIHTNDDMYSKYKEMFSTINMAEDDRGDYVAVGPIVTRKDLADASNAAYNLKAHVTGSPKFAAAIANDAAADVGDRTGKK